MIDPIPVANAAAPTQSHVGDDRLRLGGFQVAFARLHLVGRRQIAGTARRIAEAMLVGVAGRRARQQVEGNSNSKPHDSDAADHVAQGALAAAVAASARALLRRGGVTWRRGLAGRARRRVRAGLQALDADRLAGAFGDVNLGSERGSGALATTTYRDGPARRARKPCAAPGVDRSSPRALASTSRPRRRPPSVGPAWARARLRRPSASCTRSFLPSRRAAAAASP